MRTGIFIITSLGTEISNNQIRNILRGVDSYNSNFDIYDNEIDLSAIPKARGILGWRGFDQDIFGNIIIANFPITIVGTMESESDDWDIDIHDNVQLLSTKGNEIGATITLSKGAGKARIATNHIFYGKNNYVGIQIDEWTGESLIFDNWIDRPTEDLYELSTFPEVNGFGMVLTNSSNFQIIDNRINTLVYPQESDYFIGNSIYVTESSDVFFCCNTTNNSKYGVNFTGANSLIDINTTQFGNHLQAGLFLNNASIGNQFAAGNDWSGSVGQFYARYIGGLDFFLDNRYRSDQSFWPSGHNKIGVPSGPGFSAENWFQVDNGDISCDIMTDPNDQTACGVSFNEPLTPPENPGDIGPIDITVANVDVKTPNTIKNGVYYEYKRQLYQRLKSDQALLGQNGDVSNFYANQQNVKTPLAQFYLHDKNLKEYSKLTYFFGEDFNDLYSDLKVLNQETNRLRVKLKYAGSQTRTEVENNLSVVTAEQSHVAKLLLNKLNHVKTEQQKVYPELLEQNSNIEANEIFEINQKYYNQVYLELLSKNNFMMDEEQKRVIDEIAFQCHFTGGRAVLQARFIQQINGATYDYDKYDEDCKNSDKAKLKSENASEIANKIIIAPNPTAARFTVDLGQYLEKSGSYRLVNPYGKVILNGNLEEATRRFSLDLSGNHPGVYYIEIKGLDYRYYIKKIILTPDY